MSYDGRMEQVSVIKQKYEAIKPYMDERMRRVWAAAEAKALGRGGISAVSLATGLTRKTIRSGLCEHQEQLVSGEAPAQRVRRPGGGRKRVTEQDVRLLADLESLVDPQTRGDPQSPLRWTCKSTSKLALELQAMGHAVGERTVARLLHRLDYSLQANRKVREGSSHPDRNQQFEHINAQTKAFQARRQPVISVDTKKKELVGDFKNGGREWQPSGQPEVVRVHDFVDKKLGKAIPYGVYDVTANAGWVSVGTDHDTAEFAVATVRRWWRQMGAATYPGATELLIVADGGGSNGARSRLWPVELQRLADETGLHLSVSHLPPGTSKWNKIEHQMFSHITQNWRGRPLVSHEVIVNLIAHTTASTGLTIQAQLDPAPYAAGRKITDDELASVHIQRDVFHGEWNYTIAPRTRRNG
jgi:Rhodopirellula transposase DDE domain